MIQASAIVFDGNRAWWVPQLVYAGDGVFAVTGGPDNGLTDLPSLDRPCDTCLGTKLRVAASPDGSEVYHGPGTCSDCGGTGRHTFDIEVERSCDTLANALRCDPVTYRVSVVPGMVLPIHDECPDEKPADHICHAWSGINGEQWFQHRSFDHDDWTERPITLPPDAKPGMFAVQLEVHQ